MDALTTRLPSGRKCRARMCPSWPAKTVGRPEPSAFDEAVVHLMDKLRDEAAHAPVVVGRAASA